MIRLAVLVEGRTEEEFVKDVLAASLRPMQVALTPVLIGRARSGGAGGGAPSASNGSYRRWSACTGLSTP